MKKLFAFALGLAVILTACNDGGDDDPRYLTLDFETGTAAYLAGPTSFGDNLYGATSWEPYDPAKFENGDDYPAFSSYTDATTGLTFGVPAGGGFAEGGIAISKWTDKETAGYTNQCSVYGDGGHGGSKTFGVVYVSAFNDAPAISFSTSGKVRQAESIWVANSTYVYKELEDGGWPSYTSLQDQKGYLKLTITGYNASGTKTNSVDFYLADFQESSANKGIVSAWTEVDLTPLGKVHKLTFTISGSDVGDNGLNSPAYFCFDNLTFSY